MKKLNLKTLALNKKNISSLTEGQLLGGSSIPLTSYCTRISATCTANTQPAPSTVPACYDK
ncbi:hypothetical protein [uncultured Kordia sp.]|uniref:hypothetical protein n=1 Tax=uncultured Kordia sp. TaxID=507699 RepID=UPI002636C7E5|nr:hypothetical protein [uncultured Kordia sp.]